jgi:spermidine synthase
LGRRKEKRENPPVSLANLSLVFALSLMGFTFTVGQVVVIREFLVVFAGNELSIAVILANWLLLNGAGSFLWGRKVERWGLKDGSYASFQLLTAVSLPLAIYGIRCLRDLTGLAMGEGASLLQIFFWTLPFLAPLGMANGILFALGCSLRSKENGRGAASIGRVYFLEALGAGAGGILYTFVFIPWDSFQIIFFLGTANLASGIFLVKGRGRRGNRRWALLGLLGLFLIADLGLLSPPYIRRIEKGSRERLWRGLEVLQSRWSPYGNVTVGRREEQLTFFSNGIPICNVPVPDIALAEETAHYPLLLIPSPKAILVIGGGLGGVIHEVLKHPIQEVHYVEIDPLLVRLIKENPIPLTRQEMADPRVRIHILDGRFYVRTTSRKFDGLILNLPGPFTLELNRYYSVEFFREISSRLEERGVLALSVPGSETYLNPEARDLNLCLLQTLRQVFPAVAVIPGNPNFILASPTPWAGSAFPDRMIEGLEKRKIETRFLDEFHIRQKLEEQRREWWEGSLARGGSVGFNRDSAPTGVYYGIAYWNAQFHPSFQSLWGWMGRLRLWPLGLGIFVLAWAAFRGRKTRNPGQRKRVLAAVAASTGFFGTAMTVLLLFSFQTLYGYVYQWIGLLIGAFMVGLASGSWLMSRARIEIQRLPFFLVGTEILIVLFTGTGMLLLALSYAYGRETLTAVKIGFPLLAIASGFWVGVEFPLASMLFSGGREEIGRTAGTLYASDLFGAWAGSLFVGIMLIPVSGIFPTLGFVILLKLASLSWVIMSGWGRKIAQ